VALFTDTVGFIQKLPTTLVAAFRATLEEVNEARILIHVVDISHVNADEQVAAVEEVLEELGAGGKPVVTALNKIDLLDPNEPDEQERLEQARQAYPSAVAISAQSGEGIDRLLNMIDTVLFQQMVDVNVLIPYARGELVSLFHEHGFIDQEEHLADGTHIAGRLPAQVAGRYHDLEFSDATAGNV
jgi:GTP-binding protein HflX